MAKSSGRESYAGGLLERVRVNDIMSVRETAPQMVDISRAGRAPSCRCRMAATIAAPSASFPMAGVLPAASAWEKWWQKRAG